MKEMIAVIDGDVLVYRCSAAAQKTCYQVSYVDDEGFTHHLDLPDGSKNRQIKRERPDAEWHSWIEAEDVSHALQITKQMLSNILKALGQLESLLITDYRLYLTGPSEAVFRHQIATIKGYKANRKDQVRPVHYQAVRDYMVEHWNAVICGDGLEADDQISIDAYAADCVIVTNDKDMDQIPGLHYNPIEKELYRVLPHQAYRFLFEQALSGDSTDNIQGIPGIGANKAKALLFDVEDDALLDACIDAYEGAGLTPEDFWENYALVRLLTNEAEMGTTLAAGKTRGPFPVTPVPMRRPRDS